MVFRFGLIAIALAFLATSVLAYYPYGQEYRIFGTETYLRTGTYPVYYSNYYPETYTVYSGPYASYTGYYYRPTYAAYSGYGYPAYAGTYWRPYYYRDYPEATTYVTYNTVPTSYVATNPYYSGYNYAIGYNSPGFSASYSHTDTDYYGSSMCTESWCIRLN